MTLNLKLWHKIGTHDQLQLNRYIPPQGAIRETVHSFSNEDQFTQQR